MKRVVVVTGSSKGIGKSTVSLFAKEGDYVVIHYHQDQEGAYALKEELEAYSSIRPLVLSCDIRSEEEVDEFVSKILDFYGRIDVLVNNAAVEITSEIEEKSKASFREVMDTNVIGTFLVTRRIGEVMMRQKQGVIINVSSNSGIDQGDPITMEYDASKSAVIQMTFDFAQQFSPYVRVNCVAPGWVETEKVRQLNEQLQGKLIEEESKKNLLSRFAAPEEIAKVIYFLSSTDASYINKTVIKVDGGIKC